MSTRRSTGTILIASGSIGIFIGIVLSATMVGALCGIPLVLVCIVMVIWGYLMKSKDTEIKDKELSERMLQVQAMASGLNICPQCQTANSNLNPTCNSCGFIFAPSHNRAPGNPTEAALRAKQVKNTKDESVFDESDW